MFYRGKYWPIIKHLNAVQCVLERGYGKKLKKYQISTIRSIINTKILVLLLEFKT